VTQLVTGRVNTCPHPFLTMTDFKLLPPTVQRILDANLDRSREGLRIIEEWCRFGLDDSAMAQECKNLRQELAVWHTPELRAARNTPGDVGTQLTHSGEEQRQSIEQLLIVNFSRVQEALRVLEEYSKLATGEMSSVCKHLRYRVYALESQLVSYRSRQILTAARLYLVTMPVPDLIGTVEKALQGGLTLVQYRDKDSDDAVKLEQARQLCQLCHNYGALFIMNDRVDLALAVGADGVHLGQNDISIDLARQVLGAQKIVGRSTTNPTEMEKALAEGADYIGVGPVYETPTKAGKAAAGLEYVRYAAQHATVPWFAIGGVDQNNIVDVLRSGGKSVAVVRAIMLAEQPSLGVQYFLSHLNRISHQQSQSGQNNASNIPAEPKKSLIPFRP
jgi:thiamine-phosphate pyrophosphorylase